ncbi:MAG TPA: hypothetical protein DF383_11315 [Deltaproteobacteria bacterium]|nr:hypothetical protein [Deltaproteobacteria bacterium]
METFFLGVHAGTSFSWVVILKNFKGFSAWRQRGNRSLQIKIRLAFFALFSYLLSMHCFHHQDHEAIGICKACGKGLCQECTVDLGHGLACKPVMSKP